MLTKNRKKTHLYPPGAGLTIWLPVGRIELGESGKRPGEFLLVGPPFRQLEPDLATATRGQFRRYPEKPPANGTGHLLCSFTTKGLFLEPVHQVVGQHYQLKVEPCPCPASRNALVQAESIDALLDEVLAAGTLVVKTPDIITRSIAIGGDYLIVVDIFLDAEELELFTRIFTLANHFPDHYQAHILERWNRQTQLAHGKALAKLSPVADTEDHPLEPYLLGYHHIELDLAHHQPTKKLNPEKPAVGPQLFYPVLRQLFHYGLEKILRLITTGAIARTKDSSDIVSCLPDKAHKRVVAGPATLLGIVTPLGPVLPAKDRYDMGIQVQGDGFHAMKSLADFVQEPEIDLCYMLSLVDRDPGKETADSTLGGKPGKTSQSLKHLIYFKFHHVDRSEDAHHQGIEYAVGDLEGAIVFFAPFAGANSLEVLIQLQFAKEPVREPCAPETGKILASELLLWFTTRAFLCYIFCHLFGASFPCFQSMLFYQERRLFALKNSRLF